MYILNTTASNSCLSRLVASRSVLVLLPGCVFLCRRGCANQVQLSAYPDCIGDNLADLNAFLQKHIDGELL